MPDTPTIHPATLYHELGGVLAALDVLVVLLIPYRTDHWGGGDAGCQAASREGAITPRALFYCRTSRPRPKRCSIWIWSDLSD